MKKSVLFSVRVSGAALALSLVAVTAPAMAQDVPDTAGSDEPVVAEEPADSNGGRPREPWNNLLYANGNNVRNVMIDGEWKVRDGQIAFADPAELQARGAKAAQRIWDRLEADGFFVKMRA